MDVLCNIAMYAAYTVQGVVLVLTITPGSWCWAWIWLQNQIPPDFQLISLDFQLIWIGYLEIL